MKTWRKQQQSGMRKRRNAAERRSLHGRISNAVTARDRALTPLGRCSVSFIGAVTFVRLDPVGAVAQFAVARFVDGKQ